MSFTYASKADFEKSCPFIWISPNDVPEIVYKTIYELGQFYDLLTPFEYGKEWLFKLLKNFQPNTYETLSASSDLFLASLWPLPDKPGEARLRLGLYLEVNGMIVEVNRSRLGFNLCEISDEKRAEHVTRNLPKELQSAYYEHFNGLSIPSTVTSASARFLINSTQHGFAPISNFLKGIEREELIKQHMPKLMEKFCLKKEGDSYPSLRIFLHSYFRETKDVLFTNCAETDKAVYYVKNYNFSEASILKNSISAVDDYCSYVLNNAHGNFYFEDYL